MKDVVPFNFISFTTALSLPFAEHKQMKHSRAIHLLSHQTVLLLGIARTPGHTRAAAHLFLHPFKEAVISYHCGGIYF